MWLLGNNPALALRRRADDGANRTATNAFKLVLGTNFRTYDSAKRSWNIKWLNALEGTWTDLTSEDFGGTRFEGKSVTYSFKSERGAQWPFTRATYTSISKTHFTWRGEGSADAKTWTEFMLVECYRSD